MEHSIAELASAPAQIKTSLQLLAEASVYFTIATVVLALLTALLMQAVYDFGLRRRINQRTTDDWLWIRGKPVMSNTSDLDDAAIEKSLRALLSDIGVTRTSPIYHLPYAQYCAQLSNALQSALDREPVENSVFLVFGDDGSGGKTGSLQKSLDELAETRNDKEQKGFRRQEIWLRVERGVDELQSALAGEWSQSNYRCSAVIALALLVVLLAGAAGVQASIATLVTIAAVAAGAALLAPPLYRFVGGYFDRR